MSAVIIIGLVVMWAVVLIPMWLRRHDETEESRSVDRFTTAMHTLSRREAKQARDPKTTDAAERYGLMPRQVRNVEVHVTGASAPRERAKSPLSAAQRRRRTLTGLLLVTVVFLVAAAFTGNLILWVVQVFADLAVVAFVLHLRRMAIVSAAARRRRPAPPRVEVPRVDAQYDRYEDEYDDEQPRYEAAARYEEEPRVTVRRYESERPVAREATYDQPVYDTRAVATDTYAEDVDGDVDEYVDEDDYAAPVTAAAIFDQEVEPEPAAMEVRRSFIEAGAQPGGQVFEPEPEVAAPAPAPARDEPERFEPQTPAATVGGSPWEPVPVPRPTYTMKPAAPPRRRPPIDEPLLPPVETAAEMDAGADLEEILDRRWAVND